LGGRARIEHNREVKERGEVSRSLRRYELNNQEVIEEAMAKGVVT